MKKSYLPLAFIALYSVSSATNVTFRLNMSTYPEGATDSTSTIHVRGSFNGWGDGNPLINDGGDYWSATIDIPAGDIEYKFTHTDNLGNLTWESISNRTFTVPDTDVEIDLAYWDDVAPYTPTDSLDIFFRVNMAGVLEYAGEQVDVRGSFNGWSAGDDLTKEDTDSDFWSGVISIPQTSDLFFSEYIEGSSNNKALEIYNGTGAEVDLSNYAIRTNYNGNPWSGLHTFPDGAKIANGDVWVIANSGADATILAEADETFAWDESGYVVGFNGDDVRALVKISGTDTTIIDIIGQYDLVDPGAGWDVAGTTEATKDHTLVRKSTVTSGNSDWTASAGTTSDDSEWIVYDQDTFSYLGSHSVSLAIEYKFTYYDATTTTWESISNRTATIHQDTTLAWVWFNNTPPTEAEIDTFTVVFTCNTATMDNMTDSTVAGFYVSGSFNGWSQIDSLTAAGDYWSKSVDIIGTTDGVDIDYKFRYTDLAGLEFWEGDPNRTATISSDTSLFHWWNRVEPFTPTDSLDVWFRVHMGAVIDDYDFVDVRGSFNGWSEGDTLTQEDDGDYWSGLISLPNADIGSTIEYKFTYTDPSGGVHWEDHISNRMATLHQDTTLAFKYFDDIPPPEIEAVEAVVYWSVDMTSYEMMDLFSPARDDTMQVRGGFNGWSSTAWEDGSNINMTYNPVADLYELAVPLTMYPGTDDNYKYYTWLSKESFLIFCENTAGCDTTWFEEDPAKLDGIYYENPPTMGAGNRTYTFEGDTTQAQVIGLEYYNDIPPEGLIPEGQTVNLTFSVDMSSASDLGFNAAEDTVWMILHDWWGAYVNGYLVMGAHNPELILADPDGDMIYELTLPITGYTPYSWVYTYEFGDAVGGYLEEGGGFDYGRYRCRYIQPTTINPLTWPSDYTFPQDTWTADPPLTVEDPPDLGLTVDNGIKLPKEFKVSQNYPNPFNPLTEIKFTLPEADRVTFTIYNILGQKVVTYNRNFNQPGTYGLRWNGMDYQGVPVSSGIYLYELKTSKHQVVRKMTLLR